MNCRTQARTEIGLHGRGDLLGHGVDSQTVVECMVEQIAVETVDMEQVIVCTTPA